MPLRAVRYRVRIPEADAGHTSETVVAGRHGIPSEGFQTMYNAPIDGALAQDRTLEGCAGFHDELYAAMRSFPDDLSLRRLGELGVTYVMVHTDLYPPGQWDEVEARIRTFDSELVLQHVAGAARVYLLRESASASR